MKMEKKNVTVKRLKEILKDLPDDMKVIISTDSGNGGPMQGYIVGVSSMRDDYILDLEDEDTKEFLEDEIEAYPNGKKVVKYKQILENMQKNIQTPLDAIELFCYV